MRVFATCVIAFSLVAASPVMAAGDKDAAGAPASAAAASAAPASPAEARLEDELQQLRDLLMAQQKQSEQQTEELKQELKDQQQKVQLLEQQMSGQADAHAVSAAMPAAGLTASPAAIGAAAPVGIIPQPQNGSADADSWKKIYDGGFYVASEDNKFSLHINGLFQPRFTAFDPNSSATALGAPSSNTSDFDLYLGRLALSGSVFDPSVKYFVQFQGTTSSNTIGMAFIDWFAQKEFSKAFVVQMGRSWTPYSLENFDSPGQYLFADFSSAEIRLRVVPRSRLRSARANRKVRLRDDDRQFRSRLGRFRPGELQQQARLYRPRAVRRARALRIPGKRSESRGCTHGTHPLDIGRLRSGRYTLGF